MKVFLKCCLDFALLFIVKMSPPSCQPSRNSSYRRPENARMYANNQFGHLFLEADRVLAEATKPPTDHDDHDGRNLAGSVADDFCHDALPKNIVVDTQSHRATLSRTSSCAYDDGEQDNSQSHDSRAYAPTTPWPSTAALFDHKALLSIENSSPVIKVNVDWERPAAPNLEDGGEPLGAYNKNKGAKHYYAIAKELQGHVGHNQNVAMEYYQLSLKLATAGREQETLLQAENKKARKYRNAEALACNLKTELAGANKTITSKRENAKQTLMS